jgi:hypothetical protein
MTTSFKKSSILLVAIFFLAASLLPSCGSTPAFADQPQSVSFMNETKKTRKHYCHYCEKYHKKKVQAVSKKNAKILANVDGKKKWKKQYAEYKKGGRSQSNKLAYIIWRESNGNTTATSPSGVHKGIGQLQENYYPRYVGKSWKKCSNSWKLQSKAMMLYIQHRYGTVNKAYKFWCQRGYY